MKEIALKQWRCEEAQRLGISEDAVSDRMYKLGKYPDMPKRYISRRSVLVVSNYRGKSERPRPGEITQKAFCVLEAERIGIRPHSVAVRIQRGKYPDLKIRKINSNIVYVRTS